MKTLRSHVAGAWHEADDGFATLVDPCTEAELARVSSRGVDFGAALDHARTQGGRALRSMTVGERGEMLLEASRRLSAGRDELLELSMLNTGVTRRDAKFDVDGGIFTLAHYGRLGRALGDRRVFADGDGVKLGRTARFWGRHVLLPLQGVAVHVNAFNFPVWGLCEKAACAWLAGVPVITKPATSSAMAAERSVALLLDDGPLPDGALSLICGSTGDLLERMGPQDVLAFTGSAATALTLRSTPNLLAASSRVNVEADSLNAAILAPDVEPGSETWSLFVRDVSREITQKTGQKCTAVRRVFAPAERVDAVVEALVEALGETVVGDSREDGSVTMGPLATARQLDDAVAGIRRLAEGAEVVHGSGTRCDGAGAAPGRGYFFGPTLLRARDARAATAVHEHEVFGPAATVLAYDGSAQDVSALVGLAQGCLVTSLYGDDRGFVADYLAAGGTGSGRLYLGSAKVADQLPGSGLALPQLLHGGPGRAGGGEELGDERGLSLYLQRVAISGERAIVESLADAGAEATAS